MPDNTDPVPGKGWAWLATMPQGPAKTFVALVCLFGTGVVLWGAVILEKKVEESWLWPWLTAVLGVLGVSHLDFRIKRQTYVPGPPNEPDIEDRKGGAPSTEEMNAGEEVPAEPAPTMPATARPLVSKLPPQPVTSRRMVRDE